jgi:predicted transcriptional regulator
MRRSKLELREAILVGLLKEPLAIDDIAFETTMDCTVLNQHLDFLIQHSLIEERLSDEKTLYAITERGIAVLKALNFQKYLQKVTNAIKTMDDAYQVLPIMAKDKHENE